MIESCSFKRMVIIITSLVCACLIILVIESMFTPTPDKFPYSEEEENISACWKTEVYTIAQHCSHCTKFEKVSKHLPACIPTGYKEQVSCEKSGLAYRSCNKVPWIEKRNFWIFEGSLIGVGLINALIVILRQKQLDRRIVERIQKQIASGV